MVHGDHLQRVTVHTPQVVHQAAAGRRLHHVIGHSLADLHRLQEVGDKQEFGEEVLTLRHSGWMARWLEGEEEKERGERRRRRRQRQPPPTGQRGNWMERRGRGGVISSRTIQISRIVWGETSGGDSPSLLIEAQDRIEFTVCSGNHPIIPIKHHESCLVFCFVFFTRDPGGPN